MTGTQENTLAEAAMEIQAAARQVISHPLENTPAPKTPYFPPLQSIPVGTAINHASASVSKLFVSLKLRGLTLPYRIIVPQCVNTPPTTGTSQIGILLISVASCLMGKLAGLTVIEANSVTTEGRIRPQDSGLWKDSRIVPLKRIIDFAQFKGQKIAIQLGHGGRKANTVVPWIDRKAGAPAASGGWPTLEFQKLPQGLLGVLLNSAYLYIQFQSNF